MSAINRKSHSVKKYSNYSSTFHENEENDHVHVFVRRDALLELKNIVNKTNQDPDFNIENISPKEISTIFNILATCGILDEERKH